MTHPRHNIMGLMFNKPWSEWIALLNHPDHDRYRMDEDDKRIIAMCFAEMIEGPSKTGDLLNAGSSKEWETIRGHPRLVEIIDGAFDYWERSRWEGKGPRPMSREERILREAGFREMPVRSRPKSWLMRLLNV